MNCLVSACVAQVHGNPANTAAQTCSHGDRGEYIWDKASKKQQASFLKGAILLEFGLQCGLELAGPGATIEMGDWASKNDPNTHMTPEAEFIYPTKLGKQLETQRRAHSRHHRADHIIRITNSSTVELFRTEHRFRAPCCERSELTRRCRATLQGSDALGRHLEAPVEVLPRREGGSRGARRLRRLRRGSLRRGTGLGRLDMFFRAEEFNEIDNNG